MGSNGTEGLVGRSMDQPEQAYSIPTPVNWNDDACTDLYFEGLILLSGCNGGTQGQVSIYSSARDGIRRRLGLVRPQTQRHPGHFAAAARSRSTHQPAPECPPGSNLLSAGNYAVFNPPEMA